MSMAEIDDAPQKGASEVIVVREANGRIAKGSTLNPGGRPKVVEEVRRQLEGGSVKAAAKMLDLVGHEDPKIALAAARDVLDRVIGRARETDGGGEKRTQLAAFFASMAERFSGAEELAAADIEEDDNG